MSFLNHINPFYWKKVADKCAAITTELVNKNDELTQQTVNLQLENRNLKRTVEDFAVGVKNQLALKNEELAYKIATGEIDPARAKLLLDIHLLQDEVKSANERFTKRDELLKVSQEREGGLREKLRKLRTGERKLKEEIVELYTEIDTLKEQLEKVNATNEKLRSQNNKWFELISGVGADEGVLLTASHRGKKIVHVDMKTDKE